jgi:hypothetical protein
MLGIPIPAFSTPTQKGGSRLSLKRKKPSLFLPVEITPMTVGGADEQEGPLFKRQLFVEDAEDDLGNMFCLILTTVAEQHSFYAAKR